MSDSKAITVTSSRLFLDSLGETSRFYYTHLVRARRNLFVLVVRL